MGDLAAFLTERAPALLDRWLARVREGIAHGDESTLELRDHVPAILVELREALVNGKAPTFTIAAGEHGKQRYRIGFDVEAVVREYAALRNVVLDAAEEANLPATIAEVRVLADFISNAVAQGVTEFNDARRATVEKAHQAVLSGEATARAAAQAERETLHAVFMQAPVAIAILDGPEHLFTLANPAYRQLVNGRDVVGKTLLEALPDLRGQGFEVLLDRVMATGESFVGKEVPIKLEHHAADEWLMLDFVYTAKRDRAGHVDGVLVSGWDVTELVRARRQEEVLAQQVRETEAQWRLLTDALPVLVSFVTADERYGLVNRAYEEWFGQSRDAIVGQTLREFVGEAAYAVLGPYVKRGLAGEHFSFEQYGVPYRLGGVRDVKITFVPHRTQNDAVEGYVALIEDITGRRLLEREREQAAAQKSEVLESMGDAFFALDRDWRMILVNRNYEQLAQKTRDRMIGRVFWEVFPEASDPDAKYVREFHRCMSERREVQFVDYYTGLEIWTDVRAYPTADGGISVFFRDISVERRAEETLKLQADFEQQLIGIVSHDLRNPLNVILMASTLIAQSEELSKDGAQFVVRIRNAADRATRLVRDLLDFTQARLGGGIVIDPRPADAHAIVETVVEEVVAAFPTRRVDRHREGDGNGSWDPDRLGQIVQNLVTNALKYSSGDSAVEVTTWAADDEITLRVHNHGAPIPPEKLPILFEPFQRAVGQIDKFSRSVGLGLYIVKQLVDAHQGSVSVHSTQKDGTTFVVRLPRTVAQRPGRT